MPTNPISLDHLDHVFSIVSDKDKSDAMSLKLREISETNDKSVQRARRQRFIQSLRPRPVDREAHINVQPSTVGTWTISNQENVPPPETHHASTMDIEFGSDDAAQPFHEQARPFSDGDIV